MRVLQLVASQLQRSKMWSGPLFCFFQSFQTQILQKKTVSASGIRIQIINVEGEHAVRLDQQHKQCLYANCIVNIKPIKQIETVVVFVALLAEWSHPSPEVCGSNPVIGDFLKNIYLLSTVSKRQKQRKRCREWPNEKAVAFYFWERTHKERLFL